MTQADRQGWIAKKVKEYLTDCSTDIRFTGDGFRSLLRDAMQFADQHPISASGCPDTTTETLDKAVRLVRVFVTDEGLRNTLIDELGELYPHDRPNT